MTTESSAIANMREQIKVRGLTVRSGFKETPLTRFRGTLTTWDPYTQVARTPGWADRIMIRLQFDDEDLEVIHSDTPYSHPNAVIEIPYSDSGIRADGQGGSWAFFTESCLEHIPEGQGLDALLKHNLELEWRDTYINSGGESAKVMVWNGQANKAVQRQTWILVGIDGVVFGGLEWKSAITAVAAPSSEGLADLDTQIANAIDGKNKTEANSALMNMDSVRASRMTDVMSGSIYDDLVAAGKITVDGGGVYHKV